MRGSRTTRTGCGCLSERSDQAPVQRTQAPAFYSKASPVDTAKRELSFRRAVNRCAFRFLLTNSSQSLCCLSDRRHRGGA